jgi:sulfite reductase (NADPH) flavoprotein alpha-component
MSKMDGFQPGLTSEQWAQVKALAVDLSAEQVNWIGGYFSGFAEARRLGADGPGSTVAAEPAAPAAAEPLPAGQRGLTILYGTETGNSRVLAEAIAGKAGALGLATTARDMGEYRASQLKDAEDVLFVVSTCGDGDPPQPALGFFELLDSRKAPKLDGLRYAVLALGDSTYEFYCSAGKRLDRRLEALGARRLADRIDCDVDELPAGEAWAERLLTGLATEAPARAAAPAAARPAATAPAASQNAPVLAAVLENTVITGRGSSKEVRHIELDLAGTGLAYEPGDALGIAPRNDRAVAEDLLDALQLGGSATVEVNGATLPLAEALETRFEIALATPKFLEQWARLSGAAELADLAGTERNSARAAFLEGHHVVDIVKRYPAEIEAQAFADSLRKFQPRLYSIASSQAAQDGAAHLTVATVQYQLHGTDRFGVVSGALSRLGDAEAELPVYIKPNPHFRLPADDAPIIMIGAGTGVAPYRAFLQERELRGASGRSWLVFGERRFRTDFLYQIDWQGWLASGALTRMDVAFSRDGVNKTYVQQRLREASADIWAWLEDGAHIYVCGDAKGMAPDVNAALLAIIAEEGRLDAETAQDYLRGLIEAHRYSRDVY